MPNRGITISSGNGKSLNVLVCQLVKVHFVFSTLRIIPSTSSDAFSMFMMKSG